MGSPSRGRPGNAARPSCYRNRSLPYSAVDGIQGALGREAQHYRLRVIQDPGNCNVDRPDPGEVLSRLGKHQVQVLGRRYLPSCPQQELMRAATPQESYGDRGTKPVALAPSWRWRGRQDSPGTVCASRRRPCRNPVPLYYSSGLLSRQAPASRVQSSWESMSDSASALNCTSRSLSSRTPAAPLYRGCRGVA